MPGPAGASAAGPIDRSRGPARGRVGRVLRAAGAGEPAGCVRSRTDPARLHRASPPHLEQERHHSAATAPTKGRAPPVLRSSVRGGRRRPAPTTGCRAHRDRAWPPRPARVLRSPPRRRRSVSRCGPRTGRRRGGAATGPGRVQAVRDRPPATAGRRRRSTKVSSTAGDVEAFAPGDRRGDRGDLAQKIGCGVRPRSDGDPHEGTVVDHPGHGPVDGRQDEGPQDPETSAVTANGKVHRSTPDRRCSTGTRHRTVPARQSCMSNPPRPRTFASRDGRHQRRRSSTMTIFRMKC